ncbi:MAG TPA: amidohydrolase family protein [Sphingomonas sp.]|nr:amidohydrolase family protein [Sphingomonas sp.]
MRMIDRRQFMGGGLALAMTAPLRARAMAGATLDIAYINARVWTGQGLAARSDAIGTIGRHVAALGSAEVRTRTGRTTKIVDLQGAFVVPGMTDCHTHFTRASVMLSWPSLRDADTPAEFTRRIAVSARALPPGEWLQGGNWDADRWGGELPQKGWIDAVTPDTPVAVIRYDLHMLLLNSVALKLAGIDRHTPDVPGGVIGRDASGEPTGILKDAARDLVTRVIPKPSDATVEAAIRRGIALGLSHGVTQVHNTDVDWVTHDALRRMRARGETDMRFYSFTPLKDWERTAALVRAEGKGDDWVRWGASKLVYDGSLGSRTALFYEPYEDDPNTRGYAVQKIEDVRRWMLAADKAGLQIAAHAIGDEANDTVLDLMAEVTRTNGRRDRRFRIEHAQSLSKAALPRFARQNVIASVQPYHAIDDGRWAIKRIGAERLKRTYAFESLIASGAHVCCGSDWPVAPLDPRTGMKAAVLRETLDGKNPHGWYPEQRISLAHALAGYTREAGYAGMTEDRMGRLAPGYLADLVVLDRDLFAIDPETLDRVKVLRTIVDGKQRFG